MAHFVDRTGDRWDISLTLADLRRVKDQTGNDLMAVVNGDTEAAWLADVYAMFAVLCVLTERQRNERGLTVDDFAERIESQEIAEAASLAIASAVIDFFHPSMRSLGHQILTETVDQFQALRSQVSDVPPSAVSDSVRIALNALRGKSQAS